jgi:AraC-like DNA-binding protein
MQGDHAWTGRLFFGPDWLLYAGPVASTALHAHHALQIVVAVDDAVLLRDASGRTLACRTAIVPPRAAHAIAAGAKMALVLHVPTEKPSGRRLCALPIAAEDVVAWQAASTVMGSPSRLIPSTWDDAVIVVDRLLDDVAASAGPTRVRHPAVLHVLHTLPGLLADGDVRAAALAARCGLSVSRLSHLFNDEVGTPLRPFILWLRLQTAGRHISGGASLTHAAHAAGFHDSAHLSRVFKSTFGLSPSTLLGSIQWVLPPVTP